MATMSETQSSISSNDDSSPHFSPTRLFTNSRKLLQPKKHKTKYLQIPKRGSSSTKLGCSSHQTIGLKSKRCAKERDQARESENTDNSVEFLEPEFNHCTGIHHDHFHSRMEWLNNVLQVFFSSL